MTVPRRLENWRLTSHNRATTVRFGDRSGEVAHG